MIAPTSVDAYLAALPDDRRRALTAVRDVIRAHLPDGYEEGIQFGMIGYYVPRSIYPRGYRANPKEPLPFAGLASQKRHMALYLMCVYADDSLAAWLASEYAKAGKRLDMGKACLRFERLEDLPLDVVGRLIERVPVSAYVARCEALSGRAGRTARAATPAGARAPRERVRGRPRTG